MAVEGAYALLNWEVRVAGRCLTVPRWTVRAALLATCALGPALFLAGQSRQFPMDDAYIHFQYARNLAETGRLEFNPGEFRGLGTTSLLWVALLAGGYRLGLPLDTCARLLGIASLLIATWCVWGLARPSFGEGSPRRTDAAGFTTAALFALSGNVIWFTLSGMETPLFLALGLLTLLCYERRWWWGVGLGVALATLCRPEGLALIPTVGVLELIRLRKGGGSAHWRQWALAVALATIPVGLWFAFCHATTGQWLPTTFAGKRVAQLDAVRHFLGVVPALGLYTGCAQCVYIVLWAFYALMYVFGVAGMPGPSLMMSPHVGAAVSVRLSVVGLVLALVALLPLLVTGLRALARFARGADGNDMRALACLGVWVWAGMHNLSYLVLLPNTGTGTRYQALNHLMLWWLVALGLFAVSRRTWLTICAAAVALMVVTDVGYWQGVYGANLAHMSRVRIAAAECLRALPAGARVAAYDIGALRYFGDKPIIDLGGLTDAGFVRYQRQGRVDQYLKDRGATHLALPERHSTDRAALYDFAAYLGLDHSPLYTLKPLARFETERDLWQRGNEATANYQPSVRIYELQWR